MNPVVESKERLVDDFFKVDRYKVRMPKLDGSLSQVRKQLVLDRGDAVAVLLYRTDTQKVILVRQFRFPASQKIDGWLLEVVAGMVDDGEMPEVAAKRETEEESGYAIEKLEFIANFFPTPGGSNERIFLYYGEVNPSMRKSAGGGLLSEGEDIEVLEFPLAELKMMLEKGELYDAKTLIAVQWLLAKRATGDSRD